MVWKKRDITLKELNALSENTMGAHLGIIFTDVQEDRLVATMPVYEATHQPYGLLHGGASAALAETVGSVASWLTTDPDMHWCVGIEINCNHIKGKRTGLVTATAMPLHIGRATHVWDIRITDETDHLICISRLTVSIIENRNKK
jgi:1,4-dihydroxy-2-naphthoyl-CoA hydrolase